MLLKEMCTPEVVCCGPETRVTEAARMMRHRHVGDLVVVDNPDEERTPLGVVTDRDLVVEVLANGLDPSATTLASLMRTPVVLANESEDTSQLIERMRTDGVRRVPVVNHHGGVVGIVTLNDLLNVVIGDARALLEIIVKGQSREQHLRR